MTSQLPVQGAQVQGAQELLSALERLTALMQRELAELKAMRPFALGALQNEKLALVQAYEKALEAMKQRPEAARGLPAPIKAKLTEAARRFQATLTDNLRALNANKVANERLHQAILQSLEQQRHGPSADAYGANRAQRPRRGAGALSIAYDRRL